MMNLNEIFVKAYDSTVLPIRNYNCQHSYCFDIFFSENMTLFPSRVNVVNTGIMINLNPSLVITVKDVNCCGREWHTINKFLFGDPQTNIISVPVISSKMCNILAGTQLAHIQISYISAFTAICQGIKLFINTLTFYDLGLLTKIILIIRTS